MLQLIISLDINDNPCVMYWKSFLKKCIAIFGTVVFSTALSGCDLDTQSLTVPVTPEYHLTYTVALTWTGMRERIAVASSQNGISKPGDWSEIWDKTYNSGATLYRSRNGRFLYMGMYWKNYRYDLATHELRGSCSDLEPDLTSFGKNLSALMRTGSAEIETADPEGMRRFVFIEPGSQGDIPANPPRSRYYADLDYLGRFGVVRPHGSENGNVGFTPAGKEPEPRLALDVSCG